MIFNNLSTCQIRLGGTNYSVVQMNDDQLEMSFRSTYEPSSSRVSLPLSV